MRLSLLSSNRLTGHRKNVLVTYSICLAYGFHCCDWKLLPKQLGKAEVYFIFCFQAERCSESVQIALLWSGHHYRLVIIKVNLNRSCFVLTSGGCCKGPLQQPWSCFPLHQVSSVQEMQVFKKFIPPWISSSLHSII